MRDPLLDRLDEWGHRQSAPAPDAGRFVRAVGRRRWLRRAKPAVGLCAVAAVAAAIWLMFPPRTADSPPVPRAQAPASATLGELTLVNRDADPSHLRLASGASVSGEVVRVADRLNPRVVAQLLNGW